MTSMKLLAIILDFPPPCNLPATLTEEAVRTLYLGPKWDGTGGIAQKFSLCSYGRLTINETAFRAVRVVIDCSAPIQSCAYWVIRSVGEKVARAQIGLQAFSSFSHFTYILPPAMGVVCPWAGLAYLPGKQTWFQTSGYGVYRWAKVMQETLHNFGR